MQIESVNFLVVLDPVQFGAEMLFRAMPRPLFALGLCDAQHRIIQGLYQASLGARV